MSRQDYELRFTPRLLCGASEAKFASPRLKRPVWNTDLAGQLPNAWARFCVGMIEVNFSDTLVDSCRENVFPPALQPFAGQASKRGDWE